ncbi:hypothetical protein [Streptomyces candidus]|uniref:Collagen-like protein n=1 Tax=Streptomyces candidus TaxID=67283 RepID=A0A7X0LR95_9ACTN|nr:hypothetical protein [Streptomyces candidus]MBB6437910.1 hypothetical protein [Streptomyces candidus]GHH49775.1 hypothetical protein GCM10018773_45660 [Streptomyces candidus]
MSAAPRPRLRHRKVLWRALVALLTCAAVLALPTGGGPGGLADAGAGNGASSSGASEQGGALGLPGGSGTAGFPGTAGLHGAAGLPGASGEGEAVPDGSVDTELRPQAGSARRPSVAPSWPRHRPPAVVTGARPVRLPQAGAPAGTAPARGPAPYVVRCAVLRC